MIGVLNNDNRSGANAELTDLAGRLGMRSFRLVRLRKNIDTQPSKEPVAVAVICLFNRQVSSPELDLRYQMDKKVRWVKGTGEKRAGLYRPMRCDALLRVNSGWGAGWQEVNGPNCDLSLVKV